MSLSGQSILIVADAVLPVPPLGYGGSERVIDLLCVGLTKLGYEVRLLGHKASSTQATLVPYDSPDNASRASRAYCKLSFFAKLMRELQNVNLVHAFSRPDYLLPALAFSKRPLVCTFENPIHENETRWILSKRKRDLLFTSVSNAQRSHVHNLGTWHTVYNAVDTNRFHFNLRSAVPPYLAFLGRFAEFKGAHIAIHAASASGMNLVLAGNVPKIPQEQEYFNREIAPRINGTSVRWVGEVDDIQKQEILGGAVASLFPILWDEPCSIAMVESLACGTPVVALRRGSAAELVRDGITGFVVDTPAEMTAAVRRVDSLDRRKCREDVQSRFSAETMVAEYERAYRRLLGNQTV